MKEQIFDFIKSSIWDLEVAGVNPKYIKILLPKYLLSFLFEETLNLKSDMFVYGCKINFHYKDEVVVYDENYFNNKTNFKTFTL